MRLAVAHARRLACFRVSILNEALIDNGALSEPIADSCQSLGRTECGSEAALSILAPATCRFTLVSRILRD